jgi:hypothetical protein
VSRETGAGFRAIKLNLLVVIKDAIANRDAIVAKNSYWTELLFELTTNILLVIIAGLVLVGKEGWKHTIRMARSISPSDL